MGHVTPDPRRPLTAPPTPNLPDSGTILTDTTNDTVRRFNTAGPIVPADHYHLPPLRRSGFEEVLQLVEDANYFIVYAPRQTGKTTSLRALCDALNDRGYRAIHANIQPARSAGDDVDGAIRSVFDVLALRENTTLGDDTLERIVESIEDGSRPNTAVMKAFSRWAGADSRPLVVVLDEVDALSGPPLLSLLNQLRAGYEIRPERFPHSVVVCGLRDVRDYFTPRASPFDIVAKSLRLGDFSEAEVRALLGQHTEETGQRFAPEAVDEVWRSTRGQPWLVNALAYDACFEDPEGRNRNREITRKAIDAARERLILEGPAHFGQIAQRLEEERVRRVLDPILAGADTPPDFSAEDLRYVRDLGLITTEPTIRIANPIYGEVIPRLLAEEVRGRIDLDSARFVRADGGLDVSALLRACQQFFRENAEWWWQGSDFREYGAQLLLQAFPQRVVNAGGRISREHGPGRGRTDLLISWRQRGEPQVFLIECQVRRQRDGVDEVIRRGALQTAGYVDRSGAAEGHLLVFDRDERKSWEDKVFHCEVLVRRADGAACPKDDVRGVFPGSAPPAPGERTIQVWGM